MTPREVERRTIRSLGKHVFQPKAPLETVPKQAETFAGELIANTTPTRVNLQREAAEKQVSHLKSSAQRREHFHGKEILFQFLKGHLHATGMSTGIFLYETARHSRERKAVVEFFDNFFAEAIPEIKAPIVTRA